MDQDAERTQLGCRHGLKRDRKQALRREGTIKYSGLKTMPAPTATPVENNTAASEAADLRLEADRLIRSAMELRELEQWDEMVALSNQAFEISQRIEYRGGLARSIGIQAFVHYVRSNYRTALASCVEAMRLANGDPEIEARVRPVFALVHWSLGNFEEALRHTSQSMTLLRTIDDPISQAFNYAIQGGILHSLGNYEKALAAFLESLEQFRSIDYPVGVSRALSGIGSTYHALELYDSAQECHQQSLDIARSVDHRTAISRALNDLGELHERRGELDRALELHREALAIRREEGYRHSEITSLFNIGHNYLKRREFDSAREHFETGLAIAVEIEARPKISQLHHALSEVFEAQGQLGEALTHFKRHDAIKTELFKDNSALRQKALELEGELIITRKDAEIERLQNVELKQKTEQLAHALEQLQLAQVQLVNSEKMAALGGLVAAVAHEINTPLGVIRSSADTLRRGLEKVSVSGTTPRVMAALAANAELVSDGTQRIEAMVDRLKGFSNLDRADYIKFNVEHALDDVIGLLEPELDKRIEVKRVYGGVPELFGYAAELSQVFMHLIRNASQAIDGQGVIKLTTEAGPEFVSISVEDTGRGIDPSQIQKLFELGFNNQDGRVRASLSLFTCLCLVRKHGGQINATSELKKGSKFTILLPRSLENAENLP